MKIITTLAEAKDLEFGEQYIISPKGLDLQKPETLGRLSGKMAELQEAVDKSVKAKQEKKIKPEKSNKK